ncbi:hypothetical protein [Thermomonospora umbrina]|uniref:MYXO-CTERM domain-containing protein n=1 Tax=Thermomonospora umbrina TaxID=111806 RepID=A0A3D9SS68_9ACTN|nr:hypothetical protein [Thermomonospora umbrina]REE98782.1 hypothetical protein DFJ69_4279 [Thermomonospora umbrina]
MSLIVQRVLVACAMAFGLMGATVMMAGPTDSFGHPVMTAAAHADDDDGDGRVPRGGVDTGFGGTAEEGAGSSDLLFAMGAAACFAGFAGVLFLRRGVRWHR